MKIEFGKCPKCHYIVELDNEMSVFVCPYCDSKISKKEALDLLNKELNNKFIQTKLNDSVLLANKYLSANNYSDADKLFHEVLVVNPYNIDSYIGLIKTMSDNLTKMPLVVKGNLETINVKEITKLLEILKLLDINNEYQEFITKATAYINSYQDKVKKIEENTLYIQLKVINEEKNKNRDRRVNKNNLKMVLYIVSVLISIILFVVEPVYGFIFLIASSIAIGLLSF